VEKIYKNKNPVLSDDILAFKPISAKKPLEMDWQTKLIVKETYLPKKRK